MAMIEFPAKGGNWIANEADMIQWREAYPDINVDKEVGKMVGWLTANPNKRKTQRGMRAFVINWLNRADEVGGSPKLTGDQIADAGKNSAVEADDVYHKLREVHEFFGKPGEIDRVKLRFWLEALNGYDKSEIMIALTSYVKVGKYAPKPRDLIELMDTERERAKPFQKQHTPTGKLMDPELAKAVLWYELHIKLKGVALTNFDTDLVNRHLFLLNKEAIRLNNLDLLLPEHRINV